MTAKRARKGPNINTAAKWRRETYPFFYGNYTKMPGARLAIHLAPQLRTPKAL